MTSDSEDTPSDGQLPLGPQGPLPEPDGSLLRNPYVLAGLAVAAAIVLAVMVVILFGSSDSGGARGGEVIVDALTPLPGRGVAAKSIAIATVREGPSAEYYEIAQLRSGQDIEVIGRNADGSWLQIYYPVGSQLKGWVPASALRIPSASLASILVVAVTQIPRPTIVLPTPTPESTETPSPSPTITAPVPVVLGPDLAVSVLGNNCQPGVPLVVTLRNAGTVPLLNRTVRITVSSVAGVMGTLDTVVSLQPGGTVNISTNQPVQPPRTSARVDVLGAPADVNPGNNSVDCGVQTAGTPTIVLPPFGTPTSTRTPGQP